MPYTSDVFGISRNIHDYSYVDRAALDKQISKLLRRDTHIALKGPSKSGKSWLRQKCINNSVVIQCRLGMSVKDIYKIALSELGITFDTTVTKSNSGSLSAQGDAKVAVPLISDFSFNGQCDLEHEHATTHADFRHSIDNLSFIADSINKSKKRLVIEDFHYLSIPERKQLSFDLKTLWDYQCFVVIIGVWTQTNLLTSLNPDLTGRIEEVCINWAHDDLRKVIDKGSFALNIQIDPGIKEKLINDSFGNVGILQTLLLKLIEDEADIERDSLHTIQIVNPDYFINAARAYANQLDGRYQQFASCLSSGIRQRKKSTGIYAYAMKAIVNAPDSLLINGFSRDEIFSIIHREESRIKKGNLRTVLQKLVELQQPNSGQALVIDYDESIDSIFVVDLQLLFYRKHHTMQWPWEQLVEDAEQQSLFDEEDIQ